MWETPLDAARVFAVAPWGSLNNSDGADGIADQVSLAEPDGTPCDIHPYSAAGIPAGATLEARDGGWWPSSLAGGTPLAPPPALGALASHFELSPRRVSAPSARARLSWALPWPRARLSAELFDLEGRSARRLAGELVVAPRGEMELDLAGLAPGLYALALVAHAEGGADLLHDVRALRIAGNAP